MSAEGELLDRMAACARFAIPQIDYCAKHDEALNLPNAAKACRQNSANFTKLLAEYDALPSSPDEKSAQAATAVNTAEGWIRVEACAECDGDGCEKCSPPASASMSAGVTETQVRAAMFPLFEPDPDTAICDEAKDAERARANTRAGVDMQCEHGTPLTDTACPECPRQELRKESAGDAKVAG